MPTRYAGLSGLALALAAVAASTGCSSPAQERAGASAAAGAFYAALDRSDGETACALLTPETLHKLEQSEGKSCAKAVTSLDLHASAVRQVEVYGEGARAELDGDTAFLARFAAGWRVVAAGCKERPELPYDCDLEN